MGWNIYRNARLLAAKKKKRFSDATMAAYALGFSPTTLYRIERGEIDATPYDCSNMIKTYHSISLGRDYCEMCPVTIEKRLLEDETNKSSTTLKQKEDTIDE